MKLKDLFFNKIVKKNNPFNKKDNKQKKNQSIFEKKKSTFSF